jgi:hypothetical protein
MPGSLGAEELSLADAASRLLDECRMVLPGIQALFGFQLIAVFNPTFTQRLTERQQHLHYVATGLVILAVALIMTPAAYHRQTSPYLVSERFIRASTRLLLWSMVPLALAISLEFYLVGTLIVGHALATTVTTAVFALTVVLWFGLPWLASRRDGRERASPPNRKSPRDG